MTISQVQILGRLKRHNTGLVKVLYIAGVGQIILSFFILLFFFSRDRYLLPKQKAIETTVQQLWMPNDRKSPEWNVYTTEKMRAKGFWTAVWCLWHVNGWNLSKNQRHHVKAYWPWSWLTGYWLSTRCKKIFFGLTTTDFKWDSGMANFLLCSSFVLCHFFLNVDSCGFETAKLKMNRIRKMNFLYNKDDFKQPCFNTEKLAFRDQVMLNQQREATFSGWPATTTNFNYQSVQIKIV